MNQYLRSRIIEDLLRGDLDCVRLLDGLEEGRVEVLGNLIGEYGGFELYLNILICNSFNTTVDQLSDHQLVHLLLL